MVIKNHHLKLNERSWVHNSTCQTGCLKVSPYTWKIHPDLNGLTWHARAVRKPCFPLIFPNKKICGLEKKASILVASLCSCGIFDFVSSASKSTRWCFSVSNRVPNKKDATHKHKTHKNAREQMLKRKQSLNKEWLCAIYRFFLHMQVWTSSCSLFIFVDSEHHPFFPGDVPTKKLNQATIFRMYKKLLRFVRNKNRRFTPPTPTKKKHSSQLIGLGGCWFGVLLVYGLLV